MGVRSRPGHRDQRHQPERRRVDQRAQGSERGRTVRLPAANGVILITTKRGTKRDGMGMDFSSSSLFDNVAFLPDFQNEYGAGINGLILRNKPNNGEFMIDSAGTPMLANGGGIGAAHSWGPPMRGRSEERRVGKEWKTRRGRGAGRG